MKQQVIIRVAVNDRAKSFGCAFWGAINDDNKCRSKALKTVVGLSGVESASLIGSERDEIEDIEVIGDGIDATKLIRSLRKFFGHVTLLSVLPINNSEQIEAEAEAETEVVAEAETVNQNGYATMGMGMGMPMLWPNNNISPYYICQLPPTNDPICSIM